MNNQNITIATTSRNTTYCLLAKFVLYPHNAEVFGKNFSFEDRKMANEIFTQSANGLESEIKVYSVSIGFDEVEISLSYPPKMALSVIANTIKSRSSRLLRRDIESIKEATENLQGVWNRKYFVSSVSCPLE